MKLIISLFVFLSLLACQESPHQADLELQDDAAPQGIVGGKAVDPQNQLARSVFALISTYPAGKAANGSAEMTELTSAGYLCTASALSPRLAITAAHCVEDKNLQHRLEVLNESGQKIVIPVQKFVVHPEFNEDENVDVALLLLEKELPESTIYPTLPSKDEYLNLRDLIAVGFGRVTGEKLREGKSGVLRMGYMEAKGYNPEVGNFSIDQTEGKGICSGDSGGPSYILDDNSSLKLVGIAYKVTFYSFPGDINPDTCNNVGRYVNVQYHLDWIIKAAEELSQNL